MKKEEVFKIILSVMLIVVTLALLELVSYLSLDEKEKKLPASAFFSVQHNSFIEDLDQRTGCSFPRTTVGHSMLGYIHRSNKYLPKSCGMNSNNIGMETTLDLPLVKNKDEFSIMIMGGSVAHQFSVYKLVNGHNYLSTLLNKLYYPPEGKKVFRVYTGAAGAWAMPNQVNMLTMYHERIDGAIALDGYNESFPVMDGKRLEHIPPAQAILSYSSASSFRFIYLDKLWSYRQYLSRSVLKHSYFFNALYKVAIGFFRAYIIPAETFDEFADDNREKINLPFEEAKEWALGSFEGYLRKYYLYGNVLNIKTAHFLQPSRLYGKVLTPEESVATEFIPVDIYKKINQMYLKLNKEKLPVYDLTQVFSSEKERIYSDHIHYRTVDGVSRGNELVAEKIAETLGTAWNLKKR